MRLVEEPLLHTMLQAQHDPDPGRAYRDYPFVLRPAHVAPSERGAHRGLNLRSRMTALGEELARWSRRGLPRSATTAPYCVQPCC